MGGVNPPAEALYPGGEGGGWRDYYGNEPTVVTVSGPGLVSVL